MRACTSSNSRTFSIAITAWSAKVSTSSICLSVNGRGSCGQGEWRRSDPSRSSGTPSIVRTARCRVPRVYSGSARTSGHDDFRKWTRRQSIPVRAPRSGFIDTQRSSLREAREAVASPQQGRRRAAPMDVRLVGLAKPRRRLDQRIEHRLQIEGRAADDLEHVGGGGLLLQRLAQLVEQPVFSMAMTAWAAKFVTSSICLSVNGRDFLAVDADGADQLSFSLSIGTMSTVR